MLHLLRANTATAMRQMSIIVLIPFRMFSFCNQPFPMATTLSNPPSTLYISCSSFIFNSSSAYLLSFCTNQSICFCLILVHSALARDVFIFSYLAWANGSITQCSGISFCFGFASESGLGFAAVFSSTCKTAYHILGKMTCCFSFTF